MAATTYNSKHVPHPTMSLIMAVILGLNAVIGAGIFAVPTRLAQVAGPIGLLAYLFVIVAVLFLALGMGRMSALYPTGGIFYNHTRLWAPHKIALFASFSYIIGLIVALSLLARIAATHLTQEISYWWGTSTVINEQLLSIILVVIGVFACLGGGKATKHWQVILIVLTIIPLVLITLLCASRAHIAALYPFAPLGWQALPKAVNLVIFGFFGFEAIPALFSSIEKPEKNVPRAITYTVLITGAIYFIFTSAIMLSFPPELAAQIQQNQDLTITLLALLHHLFPMLGASYWSLSLINWSIIIVIMGTLHSMILAIAALLRDTVHNVNPRTLIFNNRPLTFITAGSFIGIFILTNLSINRGFSITALLIVFAYCCTLIPLITKPQGRSASQIFIAAGAMLVAFIIFGCGIKGLM